MLKIQNLSKIILVVSLILVYSVIASAEENYIRVLLLDGTEEFTLTVKGRYEILDLKTRTAIYKGKNISAQKVFCAGGAIKIGKNTFNNVDIEIEPQKSSYVYVNNKRYRGNLRIIKNEDKLRVINYLDIEDYLKGVLRQEVSNRWPMHTLMVQAIAARSYAVYQKKVSAKNDFDVTASVSSQMYGGVYSETWRTKRAVVHTKGKVLRFEDKVFPTYYHATCGGHTEDVSRLWNLDLRPLKGKICGFCTSSPHFSWKRTVELKDIKWVLRNTQFKVKKITDIVVEQRNKSGRIVSLKIFDSEKGQSIPAKKFRELLGSDLIRSTNFSVEIKDDLAYLKGLGWGHGVGMCQWGAYKMARLGYGFSEILKFYYPGSEIKKIY